MKYARIYTDGSALPKHNRSGAGAVILFANETLEVQEKIDIVDSTRAELLAAVMALETLTEACRVKLYTDNRSFAELASEPARRQFAPELWEQFDTAAAIHLLDVTWIRRNSHRYNRRADKLARRAALYL